MAYKYRCYNFPNEDAFDALSAETNNVFFCITGALREPDTYDKNGNVLTQGETLDGFYLQVAWQGEPSETWNQFLIEKPLPGMSVFAGWNDRMTTSKIMTPLQFFDLFTVAEQKAIAAGAQSNVDLFLWFQKASAAQEINLDDARLADGIAALVSAGLLTQERSEEILAGEMLN